MIYLQERKIAWCVEKKNLYQLSLVKISNLSISLYTVLYRLQKKSKKNELTVYHQKQQKNDRFKKGLFKIVFRRRISFWTEYQSKEAGVNFV